MKRAFIESGIGQLHAREHNASAGTGVPLLMLHAAPGSALMLGGLQERLPQRTLAIDLPGMGDSDRLPPSLHNIASSMTMIMWNIGWFAATAISGTLQTTIGFGLIMQIVAVGVLLNGAAVVLIFRSKRADMPIRFAAQQESNA